MNLINNQGKSVVDLYHEARRPLIDEHDDEEMDEESNEQNYGEESEI